MFNYQHELRRRIEQFASYLKKMHSRAHEEVCGSCFMIFCEDSSDDGNGDENELSEEAVPELELLLVTSEEAGINEGSLNDNPSFFQAIPDDAWRQDDSQSRFVQFSFEEKWFCVDMPLQTLYRAEAEQILRSRNGFFYLKDRPEFTLMGEDVDGYEPFRKVYVYGDEDNAAEDMAFVWFNIWRFPVSSRLYVKAAAFGDKKTDWEWGTPIE